MTTSEKRRIGAEGSDVWLRIVAAAEDVIRAEGYAAASSRRIASHAGLKPSLVHYYFPTTDDLYLAVFRRGAQQSDLMIEDALASADPLAALWRFYTDESRNALAIQFIALAIHRQAVRAEIAEHSERMRERIGSAIGEMIGARPSLIGSVPPAGLALIIAGIGRALVMEGGLGVTAGHDEARQLVEACLDKLGPASEPAS